MLSVRVAAPLTQSFVGVLPASQSLPMQIAAWVAAIPPHDGQEDAQLGCSLAPGGSRVVGSCCQIAYDASARG